MLKNWTDWKKFPRVERGETVDAPAGPGVFEVRDVCNGDLIAFDAAPHLPAALLSVWRRPSARLWKLNRLFGKDAAQTIELEYRACPAASFSEAKQMAHCLLDRRQVYWQRTTGLPSSSSAA